MEEAPGAPASAGPALPAPSLHKGGGAIRGIGEKFSANPVTGTASLQIPIVTTPGRGGFHPDLSLSYDSGAGNGPFGLGWRLSVPQITRKTDKGLPRYDDARDSDVFILSGAEDLVPALLPDGSRDAYTDLSTNERIQRYRPRVEGLFARVERRETAGGDVYWTATTRDDVSSVYGRSSAARIADPGHARDVFTWLLEETRDDKGNVIQYVYKPEDSVNVPRDVPHEQSRHKGLATPVNQYLKRIRYGNTTPSDSSADLDSALFEVVFDYGEHADDAPTLAEQDTWPCRQDPFSSYRSGFEIRTYRLCRRVLMFHRITELGATACLVRSTDLGYAEAPHLTRLVAAAQAGYIRDPVTQVYSRRAYPSLELGYQLPVFDTTVHVMDRASVADAPGGVAGSYQWVDLDGEGLPGVLSEQAGALHYKQNLGGGRLAPARRLLTKPAMTNLSAAGQHLADLDGDGLKELAVFTPPVAGYHDRTEEGGWAPFQPFDSQPNVDWSDPNLRMIDLDGDGHEDILITREETLTWYPSIAKRGFGPPITFHKPHDDEEGPALVFADGTMTVFLADMSGDGLTDLVRVKNGNVCYWPSLGHGRFGAKVQMGGSMRFDHHDRFDPRRLRLADVDGTGTVDILYIHRDGVRIYANQSGNALAAPVELPRFPDQSELSTIGVVDLLGTGTSCLVWSSPLPNQAPAPVRYVDLLGSKKPYLLTSYTNNLGLTVTLTYAPSTRFYRQDADAGRPWVTKLPFVVHALERVETYDAVSRHRFVTLYAYHHGYFDGPEREFRGFGMVEQWDTESFSAFSGAGELPPPANASDPELHLPPVRTRTWYHTGAWTAEKRVVAGYEDEYYQGVAYLPGCLVEDGLTAPAQREAHRALKGQMLRQEVYADDGDAHAGDPYLVTEHTYHVKQIQPPEGASHGVYLAHPREAVEHHFERNPDDPRILHDLTLEVDDLGVVRRTAAIRYPRKTAQVIAAEQSVGAATLTEVRVTHVTDQTTWYRIGVPIETKAYELVGLAPSASALLIFQDVLDAADGAVKLEYEEATGASPHEKRLLSHHKTLYSRDDRTGPLALGDVESLALPWQSYAKAFTLGLLDSALEGRATSAILAEGGYVQLPADDAWWASSARMGFSGAAGFYLPTTFYDPFANASTVEYDGYFLAVVGVTDPLGNTVLADIDYRTFMPVELTDPNGNRTAVKVDELGRVIATAILGKIDGDADTIDDPTTTFEYDLTRFQALGEPCVVHSRARERHGDASTPWQESYSYSDGSGHEVMRKTRAEPGDAPERDAEGALVHDAEGELVFSPCDPRWVGTGRVVLDNKGHPVKEYEPFFSSTHEYEDEAELVEWGVTPILRYDPLGRLVRKDLPNGTFSKVVFDPWMQTTWDPNDTVASSLWYQDREGLDPVDDPEGRAAALAYAHRDTPAVAHLDALGRTFRTIADNGAAGQYPTERTLDVEGNPLVITDARQNTAMQYTFAMGGRALYQKSCDAGKRWTLLDVGGATLRTWDERGFVHRATYDQKRRATHRYVKLGAGGEQLVGRTVYGEAMPLEDAVAANLRERPYRIYDGSGVFTHVLYDLKGNLLESERRLAASYQGVTDWIATDALASADDVAAAAEPLLEAELFSFEAAFDALNRPVSLTTPDASEIKPSYNEAGLLEKVEARLRGAAAWTTFVGDIDYNEKGQRAKIAYGNGTATTYTYDPATFRLTRLKTVRGSDGAVLQNLAFAFDPVGNITAVADSAQRTVFFNNDVVTPSAAYEYDALYRLIHAAGREHAGGAGDDQRDQNDLPLENLPHDNDTQALRSYVEEYEYDEVGNLLAMIHTAGTGSWTRRYAIDETSNRLLATSLPGDPAGGPYSATYDHDVHGNMTSMPHLPGIAWDHDDRMQEVDLGGGGTVYYTYDADGQRVRKVWEHSGLVEERIYLGGWELYRKSDSGGLLLERETLHVVDGARRAAMVETKTVDESVGSFTPSPVIRYQLDNHLGSASLEVDEDGLVIGYEEYHPYGTTSYWSARSGVEVSLKRYRYTGEERDDETGLYHCGDRYYAGWLGRWTAADPSGIAGGINLYEYAWDNPVCLVDPSGHQPLDPNNQNVQRLKAQNVPDDRIRKLLRQGAPSAPPKGGGGGGPGHPPKPRTVPKPPAPPAPPAPPGGPPGAPPGGPPGAPPGSPPGAPPGSPPGAPPGAPPAPPGQGNPGNIDTPQGPGDHHGKGGQGDGKAEGEGKGTGSTLLDAAVFIQGMLGMQPPGDEGVSSGGIPGGTGDPKHASALGQAVWLGVQLFWGKIAGGAKKLLSSAAGRVDRWLAERAAKKLAQGAVNGTLSAAERKALQEIADKFKTEIDVVGSRAAGKGRNVGRTDLPVGKEPPHATRSDIDVRIDSQLDIDTRGALSDSLKNIEPDLVDVRSRLPGGSSPPTIKITPKKQ